MLDTAIRDRIHQEVTHGDVVLFMKGTPASPMCGFSAAVVQVLNHLNVPFKGIDVLEDSDIREGVKEYSNWPTLPQLYVKGEFIGGCDIIREMFNTGELVEVFKAKGIPIQAG